MFGKRFKLFKLLGFEVGIDLSWILIAILIAWSLSTGFFPFQYKNLSTQTYWLMGIIGAVGLFFSIIAHEFCHSLVARKRGMPMKGITLFIFGGVAEMGEEPPSAKTEFMIAIVGPLSSIAIAAIFYGINRVGMASGWSPVINGVVGYLAMINGLLAIFNLVPAFPLDGGRILRSALWGWKGNLRWATRISSTIGSGFGIFLIILGFIRILTGNFIGGMWLGLIGLFIQNAAKMSYQQLITRRALEGEPLKRFMQKDPITVPDSITVDQLIENYIYRFHFKMFPVVNSHKLVGCITTKEVKEIPREDWNRKTVGEIANRCSKENTIEPDADAVKALSAMRRNNASRLMVVEDDRLVGVIALKDMLEFLSLKVELDV
ncbi:MAG: site-2 protease family protein [Deltaproteobacteria bacterium]|jgi:Zn-dependent protease/CBS domain-containing protein